MSYQLLYMVAQNYPIFLLVPILKIPLVNGLILRFASNVAIDIPVYLIKRSARAVSSILWKEKDIYPKIDENVSISAVVSITTDKNYPEWETIELL